MSVDYSAAPCLPWSSSGYFTKFLFQIRPVFRVQEGIRLADYLTSLCLSLRTLGTVWVSLKTFSGFRWEISHSFRDTELTQTHSIQKLCIIAELRFVRTLKCVFGWRGVDSGYIRVNTFPCSVSTCLQSEVPGRVSSGLSLYPGFCEDYRAGNPCWSRAQIITMAEGQGTGCLICIGS